MTYSYRLPVDWSVCLRWFAVLWRRGHTTELISPKMCKLQPSPARELEPGEVEWMQS